MVWIWKDDSSDSDSPDDEITDTNRSNFNRGSGDRCATRTVVKSHCRTEETEPGKFVRKCEKTEEIFRDCVGRPTEMIESNKEYTEEDVTKEMLEGSKTLKSGEGYEPFIFPPSVRSGMEAIERDFIGSFKQLFDAAEEMKNGFFSVFGDPDMYGGGSSSPSTRRGIPIEDYPRKEEAAKEKKSDGDVDISGLARDV